MFKHKSNAAVANDVAKMGDSYLRSMHRTWMQEATAIGAEIQRLSARRRAAKRMVAAMEAEMLDRGME